MAFCPMSNGLSTGVVFTWHPWPILDTGTPFYLSHAGADLHPAAAAGSRINFFV